MFRVWGRQRALQGANQHLLPKKTEKKQTAIELIFSSHWFTCVSQSDAACGKSFLRVHTNAQLKTFHKFSLELKNERMKGQHYIKSEGEPVDGVKSVGSEEVSRRDECWRGPRSERTFWSRVHGWQRQITLPYVAEKDIQTTTRWSETDLWSGWREMFDLDVSPRLRILTLVLEFLFLVLCFSCLVFCCCGVIHQVL